MTQPSGQALVSRVRQDVDRSLLRARNGLKLLSGAFPQQLGATPKDIVWQSGKTELWRYRSDARTIRPPLFFVHSLVSRTHIFDLVPGNSFVEYMLGRGFDVFLVNWGEADELEASYDLSMYCDVLLPTLVREVTRVAESETVTLFGYCLGGVLSLLYLAGHTDDPVSAVAIMAAPIDYTHMGSMTAMVQSGRLDPSSLLDDTGNVPPDIVRNGFRVMQPTADVTKYVSLWQHLWNDDFVAAHQAMTGWANDQIPFPGAAFVDIATLLVGENRLKSGVVPIAGRDLYLRDITAPFISIIADRDNIVVPPAALGLCDLVGSADKTELVLPAGHVGLVIGRAALTKHVPRMADWLEAHSDRP